MKRALQMGDVVETAITVVALGLAGCGGSSDEQLARADAAPAPAKAAQVARPSFPPQAAPATPPSDDLTEIRNQLAALRSEVGQLQRRVDQDGRTLPTAPGIPADASEPALQEPERLARIEAQFRAEPLDMAWSRGALERLRAAVTESGEGVSQRLLNVECRSRSCRLEIAADAAQPVDDTFPRLASRLGSTFTTTNSVHIDQGDGRQVGVLFLTH